LYEKKVSSDVLTYLYGDSDVDIFVICTWKWKITAKSMCEWM